MTEQPLPRRKLLDREIQLVAIQINQTRALLTALERQKEWMVGVQRGVYGPPPAPTPSYEQLAQ